MTTVSPGYFIGEYNIGLGTQIQWKDGAYVGGGKACKFALTV